MDPDREKIFSDRIIDNSRSMISIINRHYIYEKVNKPFCQAHKGHRKSFVGKTLGQVWGHEVFREVIKGKIDQCIAGRTVKYESVFTTPRSGERHFEVIFRPLRTDRGDVTHVLAETFDVTELNKSKKAALEISKEYTDLEFNFEKRLSQAQRLEAIGVLAGGIAHDFNNILATISGYAEMLREDYPLDTRITDKSAKILYAVGRARSLTEQILTFSRPGEQEKILVNLNEILRETVGFVQSAAPSNINITAVNTGERAMVYADPTQLFRVFLNLMTNGIQAMDDRGGTLSVSTAIVEGLSATPLLSREIIADEYVLVRFSDTGKGMDEKVIRRIFEPFFTSGEAGRGTGLGLSVVHGIVSDLEGGVDVSSKPGQGSDFYIYLPLSNEVINSGQPVTGRKKVLFIQGIRNDSKIMSLALENSGFDVVFTSDLKKLSRTFSAMRKKPDILIYLADPGNVSLAELRRFYCNFRLKIPCILITGPANEEIEEELLNLGVIRQHLSKPVSVTELRKALLISLNQ